jgi:hypothetical protein
MSVDVTVETTIDRPVIVVADYAGDPSNAPAWYRRIASAEWQTEPPVRVGSQVTFTATFLGKRLVYTYEVIEHEPSAHLTMRTAQGPFPMTTSYTWSPVGADATRMTLRNHGEPAGFSRLTAPLVSFAMRRAMTQDLAKLAEILESR